jgi:uncharacterized protein with ParB-like and HNH nuclease domain
MSSHRFANRLQQSNQAQEKAYLLGTVVFTSTNDDGLEVIDGQQRLATTTVLIAAIRDFLVSRKEDISAAVAIRHSAV